MRFNSQDVVTILSLSLLTSAFPLNAPQQPRSNLVKRVKSYSVVNVDGGSTSSPTAIIETVAASASAAPTKTETVVATDVAPSANTVISTLTIIETQPPPTSATESLTLTYSPQPPNTPCSTPSVSFTLAGSPTNSTQSPPSSTTPQSIITTGEPSIVTVVVTASETVATTEYYDDGMWHTRYPIRTFTTVLSNAASTASSLSTSLIIATPSTTGAVLEHYVGNGQWETLYPPPTTASASTPSILFPTLVATSTQGYNHTQIPC